MWKIVITEIQDANSLDPGNAPPGAFFVSADRFVKTVDNLDLPTLIKFVNGQASNDENTIEQTKRPIELERRDLETAPDLFEPPHFLELSAVESW